MQLIQRFVCWWASCFRAWFSTDLIATMFSSCCSCVIWKVVFAVNFVMHVPANSMNLMSCALMGESLPHMKLWWNSLVLCVFQTVGLLVMADVLKPCSHIMIPTPGDTQQRSRGSGGWGTMGDHGRPRTRDIVWGSRWPHTCSGRFWMCYLFGCSREHSLGCSFYYSLECLLRCSIEYSLDYSFGCVSDKYFQQCSSTFDVLIYCVDNPSNHFRAPLMFGAFLCGLFWILCWRRSWIRFVGLWGIQIFPTMFKHLRCFDLLCG